MRGKYPAEVYRREILNVLELIVWDLTLFVEWRVASHLSAADDLRRYGLV